MDQRNRLAQSSIEFLVLVGVVLIFFIAAMALVRSKTISTARERETILAEDIVTTIHKEILLATRVQDGYQRTFWIPQKIGTKEFVLSFQNNEIVLQVGQSEYWRTLPDVSGSINKNLNFIRKTDGVVHVNE